MNTIYNELPTAFPWYDNIQKQNRYAENAQANYDYKLISPNNKLLPFQFVAPKGLGRPTEWRILSICGSTNIDISTNINPKTKARTLQNGLYVYYEGDTLTNGGGTMNLAAGCYYSKIVFAGGVVFFSEMFTVKDDLTNYMKLEFWNGCDLNPIMYNGTNFKQILYLDTFIHTGDPEIEEDGERDGDDNLIPTFQKMTVKYRFTALVPDFVKIAIASLQIHEEVYLTTAKAIRTGKIERITTTSTTETGGAYSTIDVTLEQLIISKDSCCENIIIENGSPW